MNDSYRIQRNMRAVHMTRTVQQVNITPNKKEEARSRPFSDFADDVNVVLIGDPGAGKTYLFRETANAVGGRFITVRAFLVTPLDRMQPGQTLFIDGLDEKRAGRSDRNTVDALVEKLFAAYPGKVRISCRAADWLGETDLAAFRPFTGTLFPQTPHPTNGWAGDTNPWDAAEQCRRLVNMISAIPSEAATNALMRLRGNSELSSYRPHVLFALANQQQLRRNAEYDRPNWTQTVSALSNGEPATVADLHALLIAQLHDLKRRIQSENTDIYKSFWNLDRYGRPKDPRPEEACRDTLVTLIRPILLRLSISVEPEGHMVADNRADVSVQMPRRKILCELKRDYHADVWTAPEDQLERCYTHDLDAKGFGVYCVFWFGGKRPRPIPSPPGELDRPHSATAMERMLEDLLPTNARSRIAVIVIDVSGAAAASERPSKQSRPAAKKHRGARPRQTLRRQRPQ